jgi:photosystem II stability/assembly factor-like uncharacterized protein
VSVVAPPRPPRSDDRSEVEALEALIEEARRRARLRRRRCAAAALVGAATALLAYFGFNHGGGATRPQDRLEEPSGGAGLLSQATFGRWRAAAGLEGADLRQLALDPRHPRIMFAASSEAGVFKSSDGGRSWRPLSIALSVPQVCCLLVDPQHPRTVYAGTAKGVAKSTDGGASWRFTGLTRSSVAALAFDPRDPETLFAGTTEGLFRSADGGASWRPADTRMGVASVLAFDPSDPRRVYAAASYGDPYNEGAWSRGESGVFASSDGGRSWHAAGLQRSDVTSLAIDPRRPSTLYAVTSHGLFKSTDAGRSWRARGPTALTLGLVLDPHDPDTVYVGTEGPTVRRSIFRSTDGGRTWRILDVGRRAGLLAFHPRMAGTLYASDWGTPPSLAGAGILESTDGGRSWRALSAGPTTAQVNGIVVDPRNPGIAYAAVEARGVFKRTAGGWHAANTGLSPNLDVQAVAVEASNPATIYAATGRGVFKSTDGAASWHAVAGTDASAVRALARDPRHPGALHAHGLALDPKDPTVLYAGTEAGLFTSTNGGTSWRALGGRLTDTEVYAVAIDPDERIYAGTAIGVLVSTDGGASWSSLSRGLPRRTYAALAVDPAARLLYAGALGAGIYELRLPR